MKPRESRELRGRILKILEASYPFSAGDRLIADILSDARYCCSPAEIKTHLVYLAEKGYLEMENVTTAELGSRIMVRLTANGKDLLEGSIAPDPGVMLE
ncbi:hypothetical protein M7775_02105 [Sporomusa sphaeroides DSM 2875]|uniref:hypothetical protein n=1 Tax=Sporomusa sphaeroides TaxID=47679 RepID=UPI00202F177E|nr:hypothetical protein [Sporomusa sphaeroides]MCM0757361.1 hypothetical protein [Sporomusa sphaeroides DSM 2875]